MKNSDKTTPAAAPQQAGQAADATLPTHGGVYEFDPATNTLRQLEGGAPAEGGGTDATTGEQP